MSMVIAHREVSAAALPIVLIQARDVIHTASIERGVAPSVMVVPSPA
jgi:hypothetical protein